MRQMKRRFKPMMRKAFILAAILAIVAIPMAVGNIGFCRSMPCCPPHLGAHITDAHQPDCCNTTNCAQAPAAGRDYTSAKQADHYVPVLLAVAIVPTVQTLPGQALAHWRIASQSPPPTQKRRAYFRSPHFDDLPRYTQGPHVSTVARISSQASRLG